jgi:Spaetzle
MKQCKEEIEGLIEAAEEEEHHVSKREVTTPDQFTWSTESCSSTAATVEPGYARDSKGHWLVVVQQAASKLHQRVDVDVCASEGGDCGCKQYFETMSLVAWDPDHPNDCPKMRSFKFPSKCECPTK